LTIWNINYYYDENEEEDDIVAIIGLPIASLQIMIF
jgi:hypothetical protein